MSTYWPNQEIDTNMMLSCLNHGGRFVYIGDIYTNPNNPDYIGPPVYSNPAVNMHPHDWSMQQIADRILTVEANMTEATPH